MAVEPKCPVFGACGGCSFQDVEYSRQIEQKKADIIQFFSMNGIKLPADISVYFKQDYYYRNRMDFVFSEGGPGFRQKGRFNKIVNFDKCYISNIGINYTLDKVIAWFEKNREKLDVFNVNSNTGTLRYSTIRSSFFSKEASVTFILNRDSDKNEAHRELIREFAGENPKINVLVGYVKPNTDLSATSHYEVVNGNDYLHEILGQYRFYYHTQGFFQNNSPVMMDIIYYVKELAGSGYDNLVDFFGGTGTFGVFLSGAAKNIHIIDNDTMSTGCAKRNIRENMIQNADVYAADAKALDEFNERLAGKKNIFILDPPRAGLHKKTVKSLKRTLPEKMIYVSCNPRQLAEDIKKLEDVYEYGNFAVFDMFPQTKHTETVMEFKLK